MKSNKRGQVAIFIIISLIIVVGVALVLVLQKPPELVVPDIDNPQAFIESCAEQAIEEGVDILSQQGGDLETPPSMLSHNGKNVTYLCYTSNFYKPCVNQRPLLIEHVEKELNNYVEPRVENCFKTLESELGKKYKISLGDMDFDLSIHLKEIVVEINRKFRLEKEGEVREFKFFKTSLNHPIYHLAKVAIEIINQESTNCYFNEMGFMIFYPQYEINKIRGGDFSKVYTVRDVSSKREFIFAVRTCAQPPGF